MLPRPLRQTTISPLMRDLLTPVRLHGNANLGVPSCPPFPLPALSAPMLLLAAIAPPPHSARGAWLWNVLLSCDWTYYIHVRLSCDMCIMAGLRHTHMHMSRL